VTFRDSRAVLQVFGTRGAFFRLKVSALAQESKGRAKKGCALGQHYGFISVVRTGGEVILLPEPADCGTLARVNALDRRRMQVLYSGQVQGVGFRYTVKSVATGFDVTGLVRNLPGGGVELIAEGTKDELEAFRQAIRESGLDHFIRQEDMSWQEARSEFRGFEIVR
jgi:acylphosphatase